MITAGFNTPRRSQEAGTSEDITSTTVTRWEKRHTALHFKVTGYLEGKKGKGYMTAFTVDAVMIR